MAAIPKCPPELVYVWRWYLTLRSTEALTFTEIANWAAVTRTPIEPHEVDLIRSLDRLYWSTA